MASIQLDPDKGDTHAPRYSDTIQVPVSRLRPVRNEVRSLRSSPWSFRQSYSNVIIIFQHARLSAKFIKKEKKKRKKELYFNIENDVIKAC